MRDQRLLILHSAEKASENWRKLKGNEHGGKNLNDYVSSVSELSILEGYHCMGSGRLRSLRQTRSGFIEWDRIERKEAYGG